jgi:hypothetical protein
MDNENDFNDDDSKGNDIPTNFDIQDPLITLDKEFYIEYSGIDRKIVYKDVEVSYKLSSERKLKERAIRDWGTYSKKFEDTFKTFPGNLGVMIYTTINNSRVIIMAGQGENRKESEVFFNLLSKLYKTRCGLTIQSGNEFRTFEAYSKEAVDFYIHAVDMNIAVRGLDS